MFGSRRVTLLFLLGLAVGSQSEQPSNARQGLGCVLAPPTASVSDAVASSSDSNPAKTSTDTESTASEPASVDPPTDDAETHNQINGKHVVLPKPNLLGRRPGGKGFVSSPAFGKPRSPQPQNALDTGAEEIATSGAEESTTSASASDEITPSAVEESTTSASASDETTSSAVEESTIFVTETEVTTPTARAKAIKVPVRPVAKVVPEKPAVKSSNKASSVSQASKDSQPSGGSEAEERTSEAEQPTPAPTEEATKAPVRAAGKVVPGKSVVKSPNKASSVSQSSKNSQSLGGSGTEDSASGSEPATPAASEVTKAPVRASAQVLPGKSVLKSSNTASSLSQPTDDSQSSGGSDAEEGTSGSEQATPDAAEEVPKAPIHTAGKPFVGKLQTNGANKNNSVLVPDDETLSSSGAGQSANEGEEESAAAPVKPVAAPVKPKLSTVGEVVKPASQKLGWRKSSQLTAQSDKSPAPTQREGKAAVSPAKAKQHVELLQSSVPAPATLTIPKKPSKYTVPGAIFVAGQADASQGTTFNPGWKEQTTLNPQGNLWEELDKLRGGRSPLSAGEVQEILAKAVAGTDYPIHSYVPTTSFSCAKVNQPGYYADSEGQCQVIRRCDANGIQWNYLCPNATLFNQITLTCDWYFNVDCSRTSQFYDYSNARLYHSEWPFLDTPAE